MKLLKLWMVMAVVAAVSGIAYAGQTVDNVKAKGFVQVGVNGELFGFGKPDEIRCMARSRCGYRTRNCGSDIRRRQQDQIHSVDGSAAFHCASVRGS